MEEAVSALMYRPLVVIGPSGVGKGTIINKLLEKYSNLFIYTVSHTTRPPRIHEKHGVEYYFVTKDEFFKLRSENGFLESVEYCGNNYGVSLYELNRITSKKKVPIFEIDINGYIQLLKNNFKMRSIFIFPPSIAELRNRLLVRKYNDENEITKRIEKGKKEIDIANEIYFDFRVVNHSVEQTVDEIDEQIKNWYEKELTEIQ